MGIDPHAVHSIGDEVCLSGEPRDPEAVIRVGRQQSDMSGSGVLRITYGNVKFIGGHKPLLWVSKLPPELVAYSCDFDRARRETWVLNGMDHARRGEKQDNHNEHGQDGPGKFYLVAAVHLGRFTFVVGGTTSISHNRIYEKTKNSQKDSGRHHNHEQRQTVNRVCGGGRRRKHVWPGNWATRGGHSRS